MTERSIVLALVVIVTFSLVSFSAFVSQQPQISSASQMEAEMYETPKLPFTVTWNVQSYRCRAFGIDFNLSSYNIISNTEEEFRGDKVTLLYSSDLGLYPMFLSNGTAVNGGLPQMVNLSAHFLKMAKDIESMIPDPDYDGLAIVDWESWRPIFRTNYFSVNQRVYISKSEELVRKHHPHWGSASIIRQEASIEFERAARLLMLGTLSNLRKMRPYAMWAYYGFPKCLNYQPGVRDCKEYVKKANDEMHWLFSVSNVLYPSIYLTENLRTPEDRHERVDGILRETIRIQSRFCSDDQSIVLFTRFSYSDTAQFYSKVDLDNTIGQSFDAGAQGVILWGPYTNFVTKKKCRSTKQYIDNTLGPYVKRKTDFASNCSKSLCRGHGVCIRKSWRLTRTETTGTFKVYLNVGRILMDMLHYVISFALSNNVKANHKASVYNAYHCKCNRKWTGQHCDVADVYSRTRDTVIFSKNSKLNHL